MHFVFLERFHHNFEVATRWFLFHYWLHRNPSHQSLGQPIRRLFVVEGLCLQSKKGQGLSSKIPSIISFSQKRHRVNCPLNAKKTIRKSVMKINTVFSHRADYSFLNLQIVAISSKKMSQYPVV